MANQSLEQFVSDVLNGRITGVTPLADLPALWKERPSGVSQENLLLMYISTARTEGWAREGLRRLLKELWESDEGVPYPLAMWAVEQYIYGDPPPKRGRPEDADEDNLIAAVYSMLRAYGYSYEGAIGLIADAKSRDRDTMRSRIRKLNNKGLSLRVEVARDLGSR